MFWIVTENEYSYCFGEDCEINGLSFKKLIEEKEKFSNISIKNEKEKKIKVNCYPYVMHTQYDSLESIRNRHTQRGQPEPDIIQIFEKNGKIKLNELRQKLINTKTNKVNSVLSIRNETL